MPLKIKEFVINTHVVKRDLPEVDTGGEENAIDPRAIQQMVKDAVAKEIQNYSSELTQNCVSRVLEILEWKNEH